MMEAAAVSNEDAFALAAYICCFVECGFHISNILLNYI